MTAFHNGHDALFANGMTPLAGNVFALEQDLASDTQGAGETGDGVQCGGFAGAVGTDEGDDLSLIHMEVNALYRVDTPVIIVKITKFQHMAHHTSPLPR